MFTRVGVSLFAGVEREIGPDKIYSSFLVNATTSHDSVTEQFVDCFTRLISPDFNHKAWNKSEEFSIFIKPATNFAKAMRKERFNRFVYLAAVVLHHRSQVQEFLQKFDTITNTLACIMRAFEDVEFLNVFLVVAALLGIHLIEPYLALTYYQPVTYEELIPMSRELYNDLLTTDPSELIGLDKFAFKFAENRLKLEEVIKWDAVIITSLKEAISHYETKVLVIFKMLLPELAKGWFVQRGNIFGFGDYDASCPRLVTSMNPEQVNKAPINNLDPERAVGGINIELGVRGKKELDAASGCYLKGKSYDLIEMKPASEYLKYREVVKNVNHLVAAWKLKQTELQEAGLSKKQSESLTTERRNLKDLEKLKSYGGPVTSPDEVDRLVNDNNTSEEDKLNRLYIEVRYARDTTLSLPKSSGLFRLRDKYKKLPIDTYSKNLKVYLSKISSSSSTTWEDFDGAVSKLQLAKSNV